MARYAKSLGFTQRAEAPATPATGNVEVYLMDDGKLYKKDDTGTESEVGGGDTGSVAWTDFSGDAVPSWKGGTPVSPYLEYEYRIINGICYFNMSVYSDDGNGATRFNINIPPTEEYIGKTFYAHAVQRIGSTSYVVPASIAVGYDDLGVSINLATVGQTLSIYCNGWFPTKIT